MKRKVIMAVKLLLPFVAIGISFLLYYLIDNNGKQKLTDHPYYLIFVSAVGGVILLEEVIGLFIPALKKRILHKAPFLTGVIIFMALLNTVTSKTTLLPTLYFPSLDRIIGLLVENCGFLLENIADSLGLLATGFA